MCTTAGVNKRYFYESFANLDELFIAVYTEVNGRIEAAVLAAMSEGEPDVMAAALIGVDAFFRYLAANERAAQVFSFEIAGRFAEQGAQEAARAGVRPWRTLLGALLADADYHGLDTETLVTTVWSLITGVTVQWALGGFTEPVETVARGVNAVLADILATSHPQQD